MGIQDRDYYRDGPSFLERVGQQGATVWLIAITCGVFFGQVLSGNNQGPANSQLAQLGRYEPDAILAGEVWRLLTPIFLHAGLFHLFFNMLILFWAGQRLEEIYGPGEFLLFYLFAGVGANVLYLVAQVAGLLPPAFAIGASGAVTAAMILFACHFPHAQVRVWFILPMPVWLLAALLVGLETLFALGEVQNRGGDGIAHFVHLGGALLGFLYYRSGIRLTALFPRREENRARPRLRVHSPPVDEVEEPVPVGAPPPVPPTDSPDEQLEAKLDAVLAKVAKYGQESLTAEEREILFKASELYKKRRK